MLRVVALFLAILVVDINTNKAFAQLHSVDNFVSKIEETLRADTPNGFVNLVDPFGRAEEATTIIYDFIAKHIDQSELRFDELLREQSTPKGIRIVGAVWSGTDYVFLAFVLHKRPDGWLPIQFGLEGRYKEIMHYH